LPYKPLVVFCLRNLSCPLQRLAADVYNSVAGNRDGNGSENGDSSIANMLAGLDGSSLALRVLRVNMYEDEYSEVWVRVSGGKKVMSSFDKHLRMAKGIYFQQVYSNKFSKVLRIVIPKQYCLECMKKEGAKGCPLLFTPGGSMVKTVLISPVGALYELIVTKSSSLDELKEWGCKPVHVHSIDEYDYMLTEKQELAIVYAYLMGYYSFPRRISLKGLAAKLGLSVSTLAELLRRAETKVIDSFVRHELPHYILGMALNGSVQVHIVKERLGLKNSKDSKADAEAVNTIENNVAMA